MNANGKLKVNGLEFQVTQPLDFLTQYIGVTGFGVQGNLTLIDRRAKAPARRHRARRRTDHLYGDRLL